MITGIVITIVVVLAGVLLYAAGRPDTFHISRTEFIEAAPEAIYPYMSDFHQGLLWVPFETRDPNQERTFSGPENGRGSIYEFVGNSRVGAGRLEIVAAVPPSRVVISLDMIRPMQGHNTVEYTITPVAGGSEVTWAMSGTSNYFGRLLGIFISMETMLGKDFVKGLNNLKALLEKG